MQLPSNQGSLTMTITQACGYVTSNARKAIVQATIDQTGRRQAIDSIIADLEGRGRTRTHALLRKIQEDNKLPQDEKKKILEEKIRDIAIRQQYDKDLDFAKAVNANLD
jgi:hypothetical protein